MKQGYKKLQRFLKNESGATAIEYGLIIALIGLAMVAGLTILSGGNEGLWDNVSSQITSL